jgi:hypothetical protein
MSTRWARVVRGLVAATFAVFVAGFAHTAGGGSIPSVAGSGVALSFSALACIALAGRSLSTWRLALSVAVSQGAFHVLFALSGSASVAIGAKYASASMSMTGMHDSSLLVLHPGTGLGSAAPTEMTSAMPTSGWMWLAHGLAAVVTLIALRWGEAAFWSLLATARLALTRLARAPIHVPQRPRVAATFILNLDRRTAHFLRTGLRHRGPPRWTAASSC